MTQDDFQFLFDGTTAIAAVAGVVVAAILGYKAIKIAKETAEITKGTVSRAEKDYAATRADLVMQIRSDAVDRMAETKAAMHVFWKEDPETVKDSNPERAAWLGEKRFESEIETHKAIYALESATTRLVDTIPSLTSGEATPVPVDSAISFAILHHKSVMPLYFILVTDTPVPDVSEEPSKFKMWFLDNLFLESTSRPHALAKSAASKWLDSKLSEISHLDPEYRPDAANVATSFIEGFAGPQMMTEVSRAVDSVLEYCRPVAAGK